MTSDTAARSESGRSLAGNRQANFEPAALRDLLVELCGLPSPSRDERLIADLLTSRLEAIGAVVFEDDSAGATGSNSGNLIAELAGGRGDRIVLVAHMDTVPLVPGEPLEVVVDGTVVRSTGRQILGADDKAGVAIVLALLQRIATVPADERPTVIGVFTVCEEIGLKGAQHLDVPALRAEYAYSFDGEVPVGQLITRAVFKEALVLTVRGRRAHAALEPEAGIHAIAAAAEVIRSFPAGRVAADQVANLGSVAGGGASNVIPDLVTIKGEARSYRETRLEELIATIVQRAEAAVEPSGAKVGLDRQRLYDGYDLRENTEPLRRLQETASAHGLVPESVSSIGGSDTNVLNQKGLPTVNVGIAMHKIHSVNEWIDTADLARAAAWVFDALLV